MPQDEGPVSFGYELTRAIGDVREALRTRRDATWELSILQGLLDSWAQQDSAFLEWKKSLEMEIIIMERMPVWARPSKPSWQRVLLGRLVHLARRNRLLDVSESVRPPRGKELIEPSI